MSFLSVSWNWKNPRVPSRRGDRLDPSEPRRRPWDSSRRPFPSRRRSGGGPGPPLRRLPEGDDPGPGLSLGRALPCRLPNTCCLCNNGNENPVGPSKASVTFDTELPTLDRPWQTGAFSPSVRPCLGGSPVVRRHLARTSSRHRPRPRPPSPRGKSRRDLNPRHLCSHRPRKTPSVPRSPSSHRSRRPRRTPGRPHVLLLGLLRPVPVRHKEGSDRLRGRPRPGPLPQKTTCYDECYAASSRATPSSLGPLDRRPPWSLASDDPPPTGRLSTRTPLRGVRRRRPPRRKSYVSGTTWSITAASLAISVIENDVGTSYVCFPKQKTTHSYTGQDLGLCSSPQWPRGPWPERRHPGTTGGFQTPCQRGVKSLT